MGLCPAPPKGLYEIKPFLFVGLLAPLPREGRCRTPLGVPLQKDSVLLKPAKGGWQSGLRFAKIHRGSLRDLAIPLWILPEILVGVFWCSSAVQGGGVILKLLFLWRLTFSFMGRPSAEVNVSTIGFMTIPPYGRSCNVRFFHYASRHNKHFRPKGRQVSTNIGELYRLTKVRLSW